MSRKLLYKLLTILLLVVFILSGSMVIFRQVEYSRSAGDYENALQLAGLAKSGSTQAKNFTPSPVRSSLAGEEAPGQEAQPSSSPQDGQPADQPEEATPESPPPEAEPLTQLDLPALQAINPEVIGWLEIPGVVSYPLLHTQDNQYYLDHSWSREYNVCGSIFMECSNNPDLLDFHTLVYGHRMDNDSMFGVLRFYEDQSFWQEHPYFYVADGELVREYEIFAAFEASVTGMVYRLDLEGQEEEFIDYCLTSSSIDTGITPTKDDTIMTLSTCPRSGYANRLVVMGRLAGAYV